MENSDSVVSPFSSEEFCNFRKSNWTIKLKNKYFEDTVELYVYMFDN